MRTPGSLPDTVTIDNTEYAVVVVPKENWASDTAVGQISYIDRAIRVLDRENIREHMRTLLHEIVHGIWQSRVGPLFAVNGVDEATTDRLEEAIVLSMESGLHDVLLHNLPLVEYLHETVISQGVTPNVR